MATKKNGVKRTTKNGRRNTSNGFAADIQARLDLERQIGQMVGRISEQEQMLVALKRIGKLGPKTVPQLHEELKQVKKDYSQMVLEDAECDSEIIYSKYKFDQELKFALGEENFIPWDDRFDPVPYTTGIRSIEIIEQRKAKTQP